MSSAKAHTTDADDYGLSAGLLEATFRAVTDAIIVHDRERRIASWGPAAEAIYGLTADEAIGRPVLDFVAPELRERAGEVLRRLQTGESFAPYESEALAANGARVPVEVAVAPIREADGTPTGMNVAVIRDISKRVEARRNTAWLQAMVSSAEVAIYSFDTHRRLTSWSPGAERMFGWTLEEIIDRPFETLVPPERAEQSFALLDAATLRGEYSAAETQRRTKDGRILDILLSVSPIHDERGAAIGVSCIAQDITERRLAERAAAEQRSLTEMLFQNVGSSIFLKDVDSRYVAVNQRFHDLWEPLVEPVGRTDAELGVFTDDEARRFREEDARTMAAETPITIEAHYDDLRGSPRDFITVKTPMRNADGEVIGVCGIENDVTALRDAERALAQRAEELARSNAELDAFATAASHDLQEPLRVIELAADVL